MSRQWFELLKHGVILADDSHHCNAFYSRTIVDAFKRLESSEEYESSTKFFSLLLGDVSILSDATISELVGELTIAISVLKIPERVTRIRTNTLNH